MQVEYGKNPLIAEMESRERSEQKHPVLLQTTVLSQTTGQPVYTLIKLPPGTTIESLASILKSNDKMPAVRKEVITFGERARQTFSEDDRDDDSGRLEIDMTEDETVEADDEMSRNETFRASSSPPAASSSEDTVPSVEQGRDTLPTPPSSPNPTPNTSEAPVGASFLAMIPELSRAGCHNSHKAAILGGRYVLQKTNSRARLTGPFYCNACGLRFDWHSSARMHLNFHNRDYEACDKCAKRQQNPQPQLSGGKNTAGSPSGGHGPDKTGRPPRCTVCNKSFYLWKTYLAHQDKHKDKVKCPLCCKFFQSLHNVGRHYYDEHSGVQITCNMCGNGYRAFKQYQTHMETMHMMEERAKMSSAPPDDGNVNYSIDLPTLQQLDPSIRVFSSVERTCPVPNCGRIFSTQHTMQRHIYDLHSNEQLPCGLCGNAYRTYLQFERHCELFHGENFRIELPVGEISLPLKRKRDSVVSESAEYMKSIPSLPRPRTKASKTTSSSTAAAVTLTTASASQAAVPAPAANKSPTAPSTLPVSTSSVSSTNTVTGRTAPTATSTSLGSVARKRNPSTKTKFRVVVAPLDEPLDMSLVKLEPFYDVILPD
ncbi:zinc finger protein 628-like isoform X1 [Varroa jacobsoni]|nr:zinc finger protein 628-like isoform X1 [Varroa jacobsoni]